MKLRFFLESEIFNAIFSSIFEKKVSFIISKKNRNFPRKKLKNQQQKTILVRDRFSEYFG